MISRLLICSQYTSLADLCIIGEVLDKGIWALQNDRLDQAGRMPDLGDSDTSTETVALRAEVEKRVNELSDEIEAMQAYREAIRGFFQSRAQIEALTGAGSGAEVKQ